MDKDKASLPLVIESLIYISGKAELQVKFSDGVLM